MVVFEESVIDYTNRNIGHFYIFSMYNSSERNWDFQITDDRIHCQFCHTALFMVRTS